MKRSSFIIVLVFLSTTNVFSQTNKGAFSLTSGRTAQKQAVFIDLFPSMEGVWEGKAGAGLFYERYIYSYFSLVGEANVYTDFDNETAYSFIGHCRVYPFKTTLEKLFVDVGLGYRRSKLEEDNIHCLDLSASVGWKFLTNKGFFIEPNIGYRQNIHTLKGHEVKKGGITLNFAFGWVF